MAKKKYRRYSPEYKRHAQYRLLGEQAFPGEGKKRDDEIVELKRKLAKAEQERDFLKDAAVFFAKESK
jgi:transposase